MRRWTPVDAYKAVEVIWNDAARTGGNLQTLRELENRYYFTERDGVMVAD